jgi:peptide/nickel transport system permease protein
MLYYMLRRIIYAIPILIGVNIISFALFFMVNSPDDIARMHLGNKHVTNAAIQTWKQQHGYDKPLFINRGEQGFKKISDTLFYISNMNLFKFNFGTSDKGRVIKHDIATRMWPSLALAIPTLIIGLFINISFALVLTLFRATKVDAIGTAICVALMSISSLFFIIIGQYLFAKTLRWVPISGYQDGFNAIRFLILPVAIGVLGSIGASTRWYKTIFLEEANKDYVRAAYAKGLTDWQVLTKHILGNGMIPILTGIVVIIPSLFLGSLIMESFFGVPGLGSYTIDAISSQDFSIVRAMVFIGTVLYIIGLILTDFAYTLVDPRVKLNK